MVDRLITYSPEVDELIQILRLLVDYCSPEKHEQRVRESVELLLDIQRKKHSGVLEVPMPESSRT